jgi:ABC-type sugar transport system permease subunit
MKNFLNKTFASMKTAWDHLLSKLSQWKYDFMQTKVMMFVKKIFGFIPNLLARKISYRKRQALWGFVFVLPLIVGFIYFFLLPFLVTIIYSFSRVENLGINSSTGQHIGIISEWIGLDNFTYILKEHSTFRQTLTDSFFSTFFNVPLILIFSLIIAVVLNSKFKGRSFVRAIFFMPVIFNSQAVDAAMQTGAQLEAAMEGATADIFAQMFNFQDFLTNSNIPLQAVTFLGTTADQIYDIISYSGVQILIFLAGIQSVPKHLYEAAKIEGATQYEIFWKITFPMVSPLMLTAGVYTVVDSLLRSSLIDTINVFATAGVRKLVNGLGDVSYYGIHASMSWLFCISSIIIIAIWLFGLSKLVFYYDE